jgi:antitoxin ParD1/3/4
VQPVGELRQPKRIAEGVAQQAAAVAIPFHRRIMAGCGGETRDASSGEPDHAAGRLRTAPLYAPHPRVTLETMHAREHRLQQLPTLTDVPDAGTTPHLPEITMPKNTSFILGDHFDAFVAAQVAAGRYQSATDVIRSGLRLLEERETRLKALRKALIAGEKSGTAVPLNLAKLKKQARRTASRKPA